VENILYLVSRPQPFPLQLKPLAMNTTIKTGFAAVLLVVISCKKESSNLKSPLHDNDLSDVVADKYPSVRIGAQRWMLKNLDVTHYRKRRQNTAGAGSN
jgi:hypothetical protein